MTCAPTCVPSSSVIGSRTGDPSAAIRTEKKQHAHRDDWHRLCRSGVGRLLRRVRRRGGRGRQQPGQDRLPAQGLDPDLRARARRHGRPPRRRRPAELHDRHEAGGAERRRGVHRGRHAVPARRRPCRPHLSVRRRRGDRAQPDRRCGGGHQVDRAGRHRSPPAAAVRQAAPRSFDRGRLEPRVPARGLGDRGLPAARSRRGRCRERARAPRARSPVSAAEPDRRRRSCSPRSRPPS